MKSGYIGLILSILFLVSGCASPPTQQEINSLDYGQAISQSDAESQVVRFFETRLKDPVSARYQYGNVFQGWFKESPLDGGGLLAGYLLDVSVNAKNSYGGYTGGKPYKFLFKNGRISGVWEIKESNMHIKLL